MRKHSLKTVYDVPTKEDLRRDWYNVIEQRNYRWRRYSIIALLMAIALVCFWPNIGICIGVYVNAVIACWAIAR